jgi:hypothetical protein
MLINHNIFIYKCYIAHSSSSSCSYLEWNYTELAGLTYEAALEYTRTSTEIPPVSQCTAHVFVENQPGSSIVSEVSS